MNNTIEQTKTSSKPSIEMSPETFELHRTFNEWFGGNEPRVYLSLVWRRHAEVLIEQFVALGWISLTGRRFNLTPVGTQAIADYWAEEFRKLAEIGEAIRKVTA